MEAAGGGEGGLGGAEALGQAGQQARGDPELASTCGASTATASSAPLPQTPQEELV